MKTIFLACAAVAALGLAGCGKAGSTASADPAPPAPKQAIDYQHAIDVDSVTCDPKKDCTIDVSFKTRTLGYYPYTDVKQRSFSSSCVEGSTYCFCYGTDFCSKEVKVQLQGKQYDGVVTSAAPNGNVATIRLAGAKDIANILQGDGLIYGHGETPPALPGFKVAAVTVVAPPAPK